MQAMKLVSVGGIVCYVKDLNKTAKFYRSLGFKTDTPATGNGVFGISNLWLNYWYKLGLPGMLLFIGVTLAWWREVRMPGRPSLYQ